MDRERAWKNFNLGMELSIAGRFIYNGLRSFHEMETLDHADEVFEVLYNLSVGLERLMKVAVVLLEHDGMQDQVKFEKSLITHDHLDLLRRIRQKSDINLGKTHTSFLSLLATFYRTYRYDRLAISHNRQFNKEKLALWAFLEQHLGESLNSGSLFATPNTPRFRKFVSKTVRKVADQVYAIVETQARSLNIFTYELRYDSKAARIFLTPEATFLPEDVLWKELLVFFMNTTESEGAVGYLRTIDPLEFDPALASEYLRCFQSEEAKQAVADELESLYDELESPGDRLAALTIIGDPNVHWEIAGDPDDDGFS